MEAKEALASSLKKVIVRRFSPGPIWGYLPGTKLLHEEEGHALGLLDLGGRVQAIPLSDVKYVCYVRDFNTADALQPERLLRKTFAGRPRTEGLWLRLTLRDGDVLEGLCPLDLSFADGWMQDEGIHLIPPDVRGNTQRLFFPREAIQTLEMVAVVTTPSKKKLNETVAGQNQPDLFSENLDPEQKSGQ